MGSGSLSGGLLRDLGSHGLDQELLGLADRRNMDPGSVYHPRQLLLAQQEQERRVLELKLGRRYSERFERPRAANELGAGIRRGLGMGGFHDDAGLLMAEMVDI